MAKNLQFQGRSKHLNLKFHFVPKQVVAKFDFVEILSAGMHVSQ